MDIYIRTVNNKSLLKEYIFLPEKLYQKDTRWVPPLYTDEWDFHDPSKNLALANCDTIRALAYQHGKPVGRIMGIIHHTYNQKHREQTARFYHLDCINNLEVAQTLITFIEQWAREKGMKKLIGPFGFSDKDPQGLQIEGFNFLPVLATPTNPPYIPELVEQLGFAKEVDCVSYQMNIAKQIPASFQTVYNRISQNKSVRLIEFKSRRALKQYIFPVLHLVNETYADIFGFTPMTEPEMKKFASQYLPVLDPEFVKAVVSTKNELIAFVVALPDMSRGIQRARGRIFPFGFLHILNAMRTATQLDLMLGAIKKEYRGKGINVLMGKSIIETANRRGLTIMDSHLILEHNMPMRAECEKLDGRLCKRYRIFGKIL